MTVNNEQNSEILKLVNLLLVENNIKNKEIKVRCTYVQSSKKQLRHVSSCKRGVGAELGGTDQQPWNG